MKRIKQIKVYCLVWSILGVCLNLSGCNTKQKSDIDILQKYDECYTYKNKLFYSDGKNIYDYDFDTNKTEKLLQGAKIYTVNENGIFYSKNANTLISGSLWHKNFSNEKEKEIISDKIYDIVCYKNRIYYSATKKGTSDGSRGNWEPLRSVNLDGQDEKVLMMNNQCCGFILYENNGIDYLCLADDDLLQIYTLDLAKVFTQKFKHINSIVEKDDYIYITDFDDNTSGLYAINKNTYDIEKMDNLGGYLLNTNEKIYGELYENAFDYVDRKWYQIEYPNCNSIENK